jgi:CheY-like chemotaxis protein
MESVYIQEHKPAPAARRLLVVDDEVSVRNSLSRLLRVEGYTIFAAAGSAEAVEVLLTETIDLVLLDINLGRENGWDLCRQIQTMDPDLPIVVITARHGETAAAAARGVRALFEKPLSVTELLQYLRTELSRQVITQRQDALANRM